ncbi:hypothetical protein Tco_0510994 [Tanacetum coccineum]
MNHKSISQGNLFASRCRTSDRRLVELKNQVQHLMEAHLAPKQSVQVNKITSSCEICSGPHDTQYCMENPEQARAKQPWYPSYRYDTHYVIQAAVTSHAPTDSRRDPRRIPDVLDRLRVQNFHKSIPTISCAYRRDGIGPINDSAPKDAENRISHLEEILMFSRQVETQESVVMLPEIASSMARLATSSKMARRTLRQVHLVTLTRKPDISGRVFAITQNQTTNISEELPGISFIRDVEYDIEFASGAKPIAEAPYRISPVKWLGQGFIHPSVSPWDASVLFVKKKDGC